MYHADNGYCRLPADWPADPTHIASMHCRWGTIPVEPGHVTVLTARSGLLRRPTHFCRFALIAPLLVSGCVSGKDETSASLAYEQTVQLALPDSVTILPETAPGERPVAVAEAVSIEAPAEVAYASVRKAGDASGFAVPRDKSPEPDGLVAVQAAQPAVLRNDPNQISAPVVAAVHVVPDKPKSNLDELIETYANLYEVPVALVRRVVRRESNFNPAAYSKGNWGLMQIRHATARGMGYAGSAKGLLDAETNLKYAVKYLRGAFMVADGDHDRADRLYQTGYYYHAKRKGMLEATGLGRDRKSRKRGV